MTPVVFAWVLSEKNLIRLAGLVGPHEVAEAFAPSRKWQFPEFEREEGISVMAPLQEGNGPVLQDDLWSKVLVRELGTEPFESPHQRFQQSPHQDYSERSRVGWSFAVGC